MATRLQVNSLTGSARQLRKDNDRKPQGSRLAGAANLVVHNIEDPQLSVVGLEDGVKGLSQTCRRLTCCLQSALVP